MAGRTLSQRELNRALLARQLLLERVRLPIPRALERLGIRDQYAPNAYIRLWSCREGFRRDDLTRALERRSGVQATLMRSTIHVVSRRDYWPGGQTREKSTTRPSVSERSTARARVAERGSARRVKTPSGDQRARRRLLQES